MATFSCSSMSVSNGRQKVIVKPQQAPCDIHRKEIDPNCKIEGKYLLPKQHRKISAKFDNPSVA